MSRLRALAIALSLSTATAVAMAAPVNLLTNGGFEANVVNNGTWGNYSNVPGWTNVAGPGTGIEIRNNNAGTAHGGKNFIELDTNGNSTIAQTLALLQPGASFDLDFWYSPRIGRSAATNGIQALWNGNVLGSTITAAGGSVNAWQEFHFTVVAGSGTNTLSFRSVGTSDGFGGNLDDVRLTAIPEPASLALVGAALLTVGAASRRRPRR